ncbi:MAG TPA: DUF1800 domain-containing protein [Dehalococcoidia bacterium]|nr:DUF1800 domain-containing protein [Dehalococcoidia bacterium]
MTERQPDADTPLLYRRSTRRAVLAGAGAAASLAALYAAFGDRFLGGPNPPAAAGEARALEREEVRISHLLRRAGFGVSQPELTRYLQMGLDATLDELLSFEAVDDSEAERLADALPLDNRGAPVARWVVRMANTKRPLQEKMTLFWHGLLTSQLSVVRDGNAMQAQIDFFRANAFGSFPDLLKGISRDAAMMVYLDIDGSRAEAPNENYARELMELFALGVGNYTEQDVREAARAFTGWRVPRQRGDSGPTLGEPVFLPRIHDNGVKTFLGRTGNFGPDEIVDIITEQPASARYIVRRLFSYFVYPDPDDEDLEPFTAVYLANGRRIGPVVEALFKSDVFYSPRAYRALIKSPLEYAIGALKALGLQNEASALLVAPGGPEGGRGGAGGRLGEMGQVPMEPPNVAGWRGGPAWLNSATMFARLNFIDAASRGLLFPRGVRRADPELPFQTAAEALDLYLPLLLDDNVPEEQRQTFIEYAGGLDAVLSAEKKQGLVYLLLGSPQFHLA